MARRSSSRRGSRRRRPSAFLSWRHRLILAVSLSLLLLVGGICWYFFESAERKAEVSHLLGNYFGQQYQVTLPELLFDLWQVYGQDGVVCDYRGGEQSVYGGLPVSKSGSLRVLQNQAYWVGYDERRRNPAWVAYRLFTVPESQAGARPSGFMVDNRTVAQVKSEYYTGSGFDRGHMAPNHGIGYCHGWEAQKETFLMSNVVPQRHSLNAGSWSRLERREVRSYIGRFQEIWVITGPIYDQQRIREIPSGIPIPESFFKIIVDERLGRVRVIAFRLSQNDGKLSNLTHAMCTIEELEQCTELDFFPDLPPTVQEQLEKQKPVRMW